LPLLLNLVLFTQIALSTQLGLRTVYQPLYLHGSEDDAVIRIKEVPIASYYSDPEWRFSAICLPYVPPSHDPKKSYGNVNLASLYGITVHGTYIVGAHPDVKVVVDATKARVPEGYPFSIDQVVDSVVACVRLMFPSAPKGEGALSIEVLEPQRTTP
ncbi:MAG: hypothetical protein ABFR63_10990, partial [Thermodesulfobacteriota bacterium]